MLMISVLIMMPLAVDDILDIHKYLMEKNGRV